MRRAAFDLSFSRISASFPPVDGEGVDGLLFVEIQIGPAEAEGLLPSEAREEAEADEGLGVQSGHRGEQARLLVPGEGLFLRRGLPRRLQAGCGVLLQEAVPEGGRADPAQGGDDLLLGGLREARSRGHDLAHVGVGQGRELPVPDHRADVVIDGVSVIRDPLLPQARRVQAEPLRSILEDLRVLLGGSGARPGGLQILHLLVAVFFCFPVYVLIPAAGLRDALAVIAPAGAVLFLVGAHGSHRGQGRKPSAMRSRRSPV